MTGSLNIARIAEESLRKNPNYKLCECDQWIAKRECTYGPKCQYRHGNQDLLARAADSARRVVAPPPGRRAPSAHAPEPARRCLECLAPKRAPVPAHRAEKAASPADVVGAVLVFGTDESLFEGACATAEVAALVDDAECAEAERRDVAASWRTDALRWRRDRRVDPATGFAELQLVCGRVPWCCA